MNHWYKKISYPNLSWKSKQIWEKSRKKLCCRFTINFITLKIWLWILYYMHSYYTKLFHCKILLCLRKERLHIPTLFV